MAHQLRTLAAFLEDSNSVPSISGEQLATTLNFISRVIMSSSGIPVYAWHTHKQTHACINKNIFTCKKAITFMF